MSRIGDAEGPKLSSPASSPSADGAEDVGELRRAFSAHMEGEKVDQQMAPMMGDLLTRLDQFSGTPEPSDLRAPQPADSVAPPEPSEELHRLRTAQSTIEQAAHQLGNTEQGQSVRRMLDIVKHYRGMKEEVIMRAEFAKGYG